MKNILQQRLKSRTTTVKVSMMIVNSVSLTLELGWMDMKKQVQPTQEAAKSPRGDFL